MGIMIGMLLATLAGSALPQGVAQDQATPQPSSPADWMSETDDVLELKLAHEEKGRPDGGTLRIDSRKRLVLWEGIPGEFGCKLRVEASFDDVKDITMTELAGFVLELKSGKNKSLVLIPVPHAWWFTEQWSGRSGNISQRIPEGAMHGHDGDSFAVSGGAAGAGTSVKHKEIPKPVVADTRKAANAIRAALGRAPLS
jgi:hypothetical protein